MGPFPSLELSDDNKESKTEDGITESRNLLLEMGRSFIPYTTQEWF